MTQQLVKTPIHGPYGRRAEMLLGALAPRLKKEFGKDGKHVTRDAGDKRHYTWTFPCLVSVVLSKGVGADPVIWIRRSDPHKTPSPHGDWKHDQVGRNSKTSSYDVDEIVKRIVAAVAHNREKMEASSANDQVIAAELEGVTAPAGTVIRRDSATGLYSVSCTVKREGIPASDAKAFIGQLTGLVALADVAPGQA